MKKEMRFKKRFKGLLCLLLSMTMMFGMTLGVHARDYRMGADYRSNSFNTYLYFSDDGRILPVASSIVFNKGEVIHIITSGGCSNYVYVNGEIKLKRENAYNINEEYTIDGPTDTYSFTYSLDEPARTTRLYLTSIGLIPQTPQATADTPHSHSYSWETEKSATETEDGEEVYRCSCGDISDRRSIPATGSVAIKNEKILAETKEGGTAKMDCGTWNSFSQKSMQDILARRDIDVEIYLMYKGVKYKIVIPKGTKFDTSLKWYGPEKLKEMFGYTVIE